MSIPSPSHIYSIFLSPIPYPPHIHIPTPQPYISHPNAHPTSQPQLPSPVPNLISQPHIQAPPPTCQSHSHLAPPIAVGRTPRPHPRPAAALLPPIAQRNAAPPPGSHWAGAGPSQPRGLIGQVPVRPAPGLSLGTCQSHSHLAPPIAVGRTPRPHPRPAPCRAPPTNSAAQRRTARGLSLGRCRTVPAPGCHWSGAGPSRPRALVGHVPIRSAPGLSLVSGSGAGSDWLRRGARERPLAAGSELFTPQTAALPQPGPPRTAAARRSGPGSTETEPRHDGSGTEHSRAGAGRDGERHRDREGSLLG